MQAQIRKVTRIVRHPGFVLRTYEQDISLLKLEHPFTYSPNLLPVCLPPPDSPSFVVRLQQTYRKKLLS